MWHCVAFRLQESSSEEQAEEADEVYLVEAIRKHKVDKSGNIKYFVKWEGYPESQNTWEPAGEHTPPRRADIANSTKLTCGVFNACRSSTLAK